MKKIVKRSTALLLALLMMASATVLTAGAQSPANGFGQENGSWYYYKNSQIDTARNDVIQGTVNGQNGWWYVVGGKVQLGYTGVADYANSNGWWYIKNGKVDFSHNGVDENKYGWWYVTGGKVQFGYTGVANYANNYGWWYIKNGKVDFSKTGVEQNKNGWWRVVKGKVDFSCNSVEQNDYGWWYITGGKVQFGYTGVANYTNDYGWWYIKNGKVDFSKTGVEQNNNGWWRVVNGKVDFGCNSVEQNDYGWWYITGGKVQFGYTGVANYANDYGWWYVKNGKVDFGFTGIADNNYGSWFVRNGQVDFSFTGTYVTGSNSYPISGGKVTTATPSNPGVPNSDEVTVNGVTFELRDFPTTLDPKDDNTLLLIPESDIDPDDITWVVDDGDVQLMCDYNTEYLYIKEGVERIWLYEVGGSWKNLIAQVEPQYDTSFYYPYRCYIYSMFKAGEFNVSAYYKGSLIRTCRVTVTSPSASAAQVRSVVDAAEATWTSDMTDEQKINAVGYYITKTFTYAECECTEGATYLFCAARDLGYIARYRGADTDTHNYFPGLGDSYAFMQPRHYAGHTCIVVNMNGTDKIFEASGHETY